MLAILLLALSTSFLWAQDREEVRRWTDEDRIEVLRGLNAERVTLKTYIPRSRKALEYRSNGTWDKKHWEIIGREYGPVARTGEQVQITKVDIESNRIVLQINGGLNLRGKWYERIEGGMGGSGRTVPLSGNQTRSAGTTIALVFDSRMPPMTSAEIKKLLAPLMEFESRSATQSYFDNLPPEIQEAIRSKKVVVGMDKEQVRLAVGQPRDRIRETRDGRELEDWIYGYPPGKITFVTFAGDKVVHVKDMYAGVGGSTAPPLKTP